MKKLLVVIVAVAVVGVAAWLFLRGRKVEVEWCPAWPETVRGVGEATETILPGPDGKVTPADRERARERARWKAWYFAQLRLAEQLGGLRIEASTKIRDLQLTDQTLDATYKGVISAAREVEKESSVEVLKDVVKARVVVEALPEKVVSLREALVAALRSGKIRIEPSGGEAKEGAASTSRAPEAGKPGTSVPSAGQPEAKPAAGAADAPVASAPVSSPPVPSDGAAPAAVAAIPGGGGSVAPRTGCVVVIADGSGFVGPAPKFLDAVGNVLGSALDLPPDRVVAGVPVASRGDTKTEREVAGANPLRLEATVRSGDVVVGTSLEEERRAFFAESLKAGKVLLVLGGGAS